MTEQVNINMTSTHYHAIGNLNVSTQITIVTKISWAATTLHANSKCYSSFFWSSLFSGFRGIETLCVFRWGSNLLIPENWGEAWASSVIWRRLVILTQESFRNVSVFGSKENMTPVSRTQFSTVKWDSSGQFRQILEMSDWVSFISVIVPFIVTFVVCFPRYFEYFLHCDGLMTALFKSSTVEIISHSLSLSRASPTLMMSMSLQCWNISRTNSIGRRVNPFSQVIF